MDSKEATPSPATATANSSGQELGSEQNTSMDFDNRSNGKISYSDVVAGGKVAEDVVEEEEDGFMSGEEEFEMAPEKLIDDKGDNSEAGPTVGSSELSIPNDVGDDDEKGNDDGVLEVKEAVVGDGDETKLEEESVVVDGISNNVSDDSKETQIVEPQEKPVLGSVGDSDLSSGGNGSEVQSGTFGGLGENEKGSEVSEIVAGSVELEGDTGVLNNNTGETAEENQEKSVQEEGLKVTPEGDSVVEAINVEVTKTGVAVVGDTAPEDEQTELPGNGDQTSLKIGEEEAKPGEEDGPELTSEGDSIVEAITVDVTASVVGETAVGDKEIEAPGAEDQTLLNAGNAESVGEMVDASTVANGPQMVNQKNIETETENEKSVAYKEHGTALETEHPEKGLVGDGDQDGNSVDEHAFAGEEGSEDAASGMAPLPEYAEPKLINGSQEVRKEDDEAKIQFGEEADLEDSISYDENDEMIFGSSEAAKQFIEELERGSAGDSLLNADGSHDHPQGIDGQVVTDSEDEVDTDEEGEGKELFDSAALAALLKAATGADSDGGNITITSPDGSRLFSVERPAGLGTSLRSLRPPPQPRRPNIFAPSTLSQSGDTDSNLTDEEKNKLEKLQQLRVKFLRLVHRLGVSPEESVAAQVLYRLSIVAGRQSGQLFNADTAKMMAMQLEAEKKESLDFSLNILVLGKCGVGKSATINSIFGEEKASINPFHPGTSTVKEITGFVDGVKIRVFDTPGLKSSVMEQSFNRNILSMVKKFTKKNSPDIILYVDRLDAQTRDLNDLPLLRTITSSLGPSIWRNAIVTLSHAASAPPDGPSGSPLSYDVFVTQRSHVVQQSIGQAVGDLRMMTPSMMNPVTLVENHPSCRKNREGQKVLPNGISWRPQLLLLCFSMKILSEANSLSKPQDPFDHRKLFGFRVRSPPLPYMLSSMLQSRQHPKLPSEQGVDSVDSDVDLDDLSDVENDEEDEYDQLPPFKPLRKAQIAKLSNEQRKAYFEEFDYRVKLLQKKQWKEELRRIRMMKNKGKDAGADYGMAEEDADSGAAAPVAVPLPDMVLPPSFDSDNPGYRYRFLEPTSQFLARPVLDTHGWDHDCGYDGVNVEHGLAIANRFPAAVTVQITKDKKDFSINLDSSIATKHGENGSSMAGFDIQSIGKQLAYIVRGETKFKNLKKNKTAGGVSVTFLGENVVPGVKLEDQITLGKQYVLVGSAGAVRSQNDTALGANFELQRRENDFPIGQVQSTVSMSVVKWRGDTALGFNGLAQVSIGRNSKVAIRAGINNKMSGQITVRTSSSDHLSLALTALIPTAISIYRKLVPSVNDKYSMY